MKTEVRITKSFRKAVKPLLKKYDSLFGELADLENELLKNPAMGTPLGNNAYKIRLKTKSKGIGKSGGARVISYLETVNSWNYRNRRKNDDRKFDYDLR